MINKFKFLNENKKTLRFTPYCCYDNAKYILESLISTNEWQTTVFPKEYPHENGLWRVLYVQHNQSSFHSVICHVPNNPGYIIERFIVSIDI